MRIAAGYIAVFAYVFFLIFFAGEIIKKKTNLETSRKTIHSMLFVVWVFIDVFFANTIHQIIIPVSFLIINTLSYKYKIYKSVERENGNHYGTIYFAMAITIVMTVAYFKREMYLESGVAAFCLTLGDGAAALVGYNFESRKLREAKSLYGFIACFFAAFIALLCFKFIWWSTLDLSIILLLSGITAIAELTGHGLDNFAITLSVFGLSWYLSSVAQQPDGNIALAWAILIFLVVFLSRAIDYHGAVLSMFMVFVFRYYAGKSGLGFLLGTYFTIFFIDKFKKMHTKKSTKAGGHNRDWKQIFINGGLGTLAILLYGIHAERWLLAVGITAIGGCFIDSVSSDMGVMSKQEPYDLIRHIRISRGLSGGVSALGTGAALFFSILISMYGVMALHFSVVAAAMMGALTFAQTLLDSVMGSLLQSKYQCAICGALIEKPMHCGTTAKQVSGIRWMNNNVVNLISSGIIVTGAVAIFGSMR